MHSGRYKSGRIQRFRRDIERVVVLLSVKCLQFVSFLASVIVVVGKGKVPTAGLSQGCCTNTSIVSFFVFIKVLVAKR